MIPYRLPLNFLVPLTFVCAFVEAQITSDSIRIDNHYRKFYFKQPQKKQITPALIFVLHGSTGSGLQIREGALELEAISDKENFVIVYPEGYKNFWNECRKFAKTPPNAENIDENTFFEGMIGYFKTRFGIDEKRVFAIGTSGGGHMAYKLALTMPGRLKAVVAIIASLPDSTNMDCVGSATPLPVMIINGTEDPINPYNGGEMRAGTLYFGNVRSTENTFKYWAKLAGHGGPPTKTTLPDTDPTDGKRIEQYAFVAKDKPDVVLLKVVGGKHDYPNDINVYLHGWEFLKRQP